MRGCIGLTLAVLWLTGAQVAYAQPDASADEPPSPQGGDDAPSSTADEVPPAEGPEDGVVEDGPAADEDRSSDDEAADEEPEAPPEEEEEDSFTRDERRRVAHQAAIERAEPRPPEIEPDAEEPARKTRTIEVGFDIAYVMRPFHNAVFESDVSYSNSVAWGLHARWNVVEWLRVTPYFLDVHHGLDIPQGALVARAANSISSDATASDTTATTFVFGAKVQPTLNFTPRLRAWLTAGIGWGRFTFPEMTFTEANEQEFVVRPRNSVFVEFPLGLGISYDIIEDWVALEFESTAAPWTGQSGTAQETFQALDAEGNIRNIGPFGAAEASFVQALGLSLIL